MLEITKAYEDALEGIMEKVARLQAGEMTQSKIYQLKYQNALKKQVGDILDALHNKEYTTIEEYLKGCYEDGYLGVMYDIHGQGIPITFPIDQSQVVDSILNESQLSEPMYFALGKDIDVMKTMVSHEVSRGIASALSPIEIARSIERRSGIGLNNAKRIARTEGMRVTAQATYEAQLKVKEQGMDVKKVWDATLDRKTRPSHRYLDGTMIDLEDKFVVNGHSALHPLGFGVAKEDINCRCVLLEKIVMEDDDPSFTKMQGEMNEIMTFKDAKDYDQYKKSFWSDGNVKYMNYIAEKYDKYGTKDFKTMLSSLSDREYEHFTSLMGNTHF